MILTNNFDININNQLKKGYTTGVHTSFAFKLALEEFSYNRNFSCANSIKMYNDDLDVTIGANIIATISNKIDNLKINQIPHKPYEFRYKSYFLKLFAGDGVGVVTKDGLKPPKNYPAINPMPLKALEDIYKSYKIEQNIYATIEVEDGLNLAKKTANSKVGVLGGISILGTTGFVKPISSTAYIDSIETELNFAKANGYKSIIFTLGNSSLEYAKNNNKDSYIIEIGNFIYDGIEKAIKHDFKDIKLVLGVAKAIKVGQGFKNTHNRFGSIDFEELSKWIDYDVTTYNTVKQIKAQNIKDFDKIIINKAKQQLKEWFKKDIEVIIC